jgi:hypothetical protein
VDALNGSPSIKTPGPQGSDALIGVRLSIGGNTMRDFWVSWTYSANYSRRPQFVRARDAADAARMVASWYSEDFQARATIYITTEEPQRFMAGNPINVKADPV